jgi:hypothetical protein
MNCPKCKNPIKDNATVCEWCGASVRPDESNGLDAELLNTLNGAKKMTQLFFNTKKGYTAIQLYKNTTGKNVYESIYYVCRLDFFRIHKFATDEAWQKEWKRKKKEMRAQAWLLIIAFPFFPIGIGFFYDLRQYKKLGL